MSDLKQAAPAPIYYMRDNHTFKELSADVSTALVEIETEFNSGYTYGSLCSKREGFPKVHASGSEHRLVFFWECKTVLEKWADAPPQQQAEPVARENFEKWAKSLPNYIDLSRFETGYSDCNTDYAWAGWQAALAQPQQQAKPPTCAWSPEDEDFMPGTYRSACGELWSYVDGGWKDNRVNFCHGCGGKVVEAAHNIKAAEL